MDLQPQTYQEYINAALAALGGVGTSWMIFRKKYSRDNVEISRDRAEENTLKVLQSERDKAIEARERIMGRLQTVDSEKAELAQKIYQLTIQVVNLNSQVDSMKAMITELTKSLDESRRQLTEYVKQGADLSARLEMYEKFYNQGLRSEEH